MKASAAHNNPCVVIMVQLFWTQASLLTCIHIFFILPHFIEKNERERESCSLIHLFPPSQRTLERRESSRTLLFIVTVAALKKKKLFGAVLPPQPPQKYNTFISFPSLHPFTPSPTVGALRAGCIIHSFLGGAVERKSWRESRAGEARA